MKRKIYVPIKYRFLFTVFIAILWIVGCFLIDRPWFNNLVSNLGLPLAIFVVLGVAILPGVMICFYSIGGLLFDKPLHYDVKEDELEDITILVAAYNEGVAIYDTLKSLSDQYFPKKMTILVIDNNSNDNTKDEIYRAINDFPQTDIQYLFEGTQGKYAALNSALPQVKTKYYITIDADTYLYKNAIITLVNQMCQENKNKTVGAIAGTILVRNSRVNFLTKMQEWEYFLSITTIKRSQGLFQTAMVAQGAFSIYNTELIRGIGGYQNAIAEDIVLTWTLLSSYSDINIKTFYCDEAIAFTNVPTEWKKFFRQRFRWARGSIEGFRAFSFKKCKNFYTRFYMFVNYMNIIGEIATTFVFIPGLIAAIFFHNTMFVSLCTLLLFLITVIIYFAMWTKQMRYVFKPLGLKVRKHYFAFLCFMVIYATVLAPICLYGYFEEIIGAKRVWK